MNKYSFNEIEFNTKKSVIEYIQKNILYRYGIEDVLSSDHFNFMMDLLSHHPWKEQKIGNGIETIGVMVSPKWGTKCFCLKRIDGSVTDFSFKECLSPSTLVVDFKKACRAVIDPCMRDYKYEYYNKHQKDDKTIICPVLYIPVKKEDSEVDHKPPKTFNFLVKKFIDENEIEIKKGIFEDHEDLDTVIKFKSDLSDKWHVFHDRNADLRVISIKANRGKITEKKLK